MTAGDSKAALTITLQPALAPSPQPRPAPTARALPPGLVAQVGQNWTPIMGQNWMPIDINAHLNAVGRGIAVENKWRAQRYGVHGTFVGANGAVTVRELIDQVIEETEEDATTLGGGTELERCR